MKENKLLKKENFEYVICKGCNKQYKRATRKYRCQRGLPDRIRAINTVTCSRECSKINSDNRNKKKK